MSHISLVRCTVIALAASLFAISTAGATPLPLTMDRATDEAFWGADLSYVDFEADIGYALQLEGYGQWMLSDVLGLYASLPIQIADLDLGGGDGSSIKLGNTELGGAYVLPGGLGPNTAFFIRGGLVLPTFRLSPDDDPSAVFGAFSGVTRLGDIIRFFPETTSVRASVSAHHIIGSGYVRGDAGLDVAIHTEEELGDEPDPIGRISLGAGTNLDRALLGVELVSVIVFGDTFNEEHVMHTLAFGGRYTGGSIQPYGAFVVPVASDPLTQIVDISVRVGVTGSL